MFDVRNRHELEAKTLAAFDAVTPAVEAFALASHNEDGTHNLPAEGLDAVPIGAMVRWALSTPPPRWLLCNGANVNRTVYADLFRAIGIVAGAGNGTTTFTLPTVANFIILAGV